jgi:HSP20 family protein
MALRSLLPFRGSRTGDLTLDPFFSLHRDVNRAFEDMFKGFGAGPSGMPPLWGGEGIAMPKLDVKETEKGVEVTAELPGVDEKDIELELDDDILTIKGEKKLEKEEKDEKSGYHLMERSYGSFARSVRLPYAVKTETVTAEFDKGVLKITCPKPAEAVAAAKKIQIQKR